MEPEKQDSSQELILQKMRSYQATDKEPKKQENTLAETIIDQKSDCFTEESKKTFIHENFKTDKNKIDKQDGKLIEEGVKLFNSQG